MVQLQPPLTLTAPEERRVRLGYAPVHAYKASESSWRISHIISPPDIWQLVRLGLLKPVRRTANGTITEYQLTHAGRVLLGRAP